MGSWCHGSSHAALQPCPRTPAPRPGPRPAVSSFGHPGGTGVAFRGRCHSSMGLQSKHGSHSGKCVIRRADARALHARRALLHPQPQGTAAAASALHPHRTAPPRRRGRGSEPVAMPSAAATHSRLTEVNPPLASLRLESKSPAERAQFLFRNGCPPLICLVC